MMIKASDAVVKYLIEGIVNGSLKPGDKLPSAESQAKLCGTSVLSTREAVQSLATIGIIEISHGRGMFVTGGLPVIEDLLEARRVLESHNAMMAAKTLNALDLQALEALLKGMDADLKAGDIEAFSEKDIEFHYSLGKASGNRILFKTLINIRNLLHYQMFTINRLPNVIERSSKRHWEIFKAIRNRDPELAGALMSKHITEVIKRWQQDIASA
jgi:GntR family transcriptional regulator, transcriptional repressor for pyruvate dehydrogenase complex